jgi:hypothetical protein
MKIYSLYNRFYLLPALYLSHDTYYEGGLIYLELNLAWLKWELAITLKK